MGRTDLHNKLHVIIPVHNRSGFTKNCLTHLQAQTLRDFAVIVADDGSTDGTADMLRREFPEVTVLRGDGSLWWAGATNLGVQLALERGASHVMTLNDDTLPGRTVLENMMRGATQRPGALIGAYAVDVESGRPVFSGYGVNWVTASFKTLPPDPPRTGLVEVTHLPGRGLLIPADVFRKIGLFGA